MTPFDRELLHVRYHSQLIVSALRKIDSLSTRRVLDELLVDMTSARTNQCRIEAEEREALAVRAGCSQTTVRNALGALVRVEILIRAKRGVYELNPRFIYTGSQASQITDIERFRSRRAKARAQERAA